jgi:hypothetical protein
MDISWLIVAAAARLYCCAAFFAQRTFIGFVGDNIHLQHGKVLCLEQDFSIAPINNVANAGKAGVGLLHEIDDLEDRSTRCDDIFNNENPFPGVNLKSAPELHFPVITFREDCASPQHPADLCSHHNAADCRRDDKLYVGIFKVFRNLAAQKVQVLRVLQHLGALKVLRAVESGGELKVPFEKSFRLAEDVENLFFGDFHGACVVLVDG